MRNRKSLCVMLCLSLSACTPGDNKSDAGTDAATAVDAGEDLLCEAVEPSCSDAMIQQLSLQDFVSTGAVSSIASDGVFTTTIDASAGGMSAANSNPYVYVKFTEAGALRVDIDDESALESMDWDLAARRFIIRLNGGDSGPSCVQAALVDTAFAETVVIPDASNFAVEDFYTESCEYVTDSRFSGFDGPDSILKEFWEMNGMCVSTTGQVFVLRLANGKVLKLVIDAYYASGQEACNTSGSAGQGSGVLTLRWAWL